MTSEKKIMLVVDDMELNRAILNELFHDSYHIIEAPDGEAAMTLIEQYGKEISIVLLDLIMPGMNGFSVLSEMSVRKLIKEIPVIMITSENSEQAILKGYDLGASDVVTKPFNPDIVRKRVENTVELNSYKLHLEEQVSEQVQYIERQAKELERVNNFMIDTLSTIVEFRDLDTGQHVKRIRRLTKTLLLALVRDHREYELSDDEINTIASASAMHDIGKISIPDNILLKPGKLTAEEFEVMKTHTTMGCRLLDSLNYIQTNDYFKYCYDICRHHHERWDGKGYPDGLKGSEISIWAQVVSLADVYDALTSDRVYKKAYSPEIATQMILDGECGAFNPVLLEEFMKVKGIIGLEDEEPREEDEAIRAVINAIPDAEELSEKLSSRTLRLLELERKKYKILSELSGEVVFNYDRKKDLMELSGKSLEDLGCGECIEHFTEYVKNHACIFRKDIRVMKKMQVELRHSAVGQKAELRLKTKGGEYQWFEVNIYSLNGGEDSVQDRVYIGKLTNINKRKTERDRLRMEANTDDLTGLCNHKAAKGRIDRVLEAEGSENGVLVFFDIDNFKNVNDTYGHMTGDIVLRAIGQLLMGHFRKQDVLARVGGDEFVVFFDGYANRDNLIHKLRELKDLFGQIAVDGLPQLKITCSIGAACYPGDGRDYATLFAKADHALYCSKNRGKNRYTIYDREEDIMRELSGTPGLTKIDK